MTLDFTNVNAFQAMIQRQVAIAIEEDVGQGDYTAQLIPAHQTATATIITREPAVLCGIPWVDACFQAISPETTITWHASEGSLIQANQTLCTIHGAARALLTAERCALNFLQTLSATATLTKQYVDAIQGTTSRIYDTRKTIPGLRYAQKYAVKIGGGENQRLALDDGILIKENHIAAAGSIPAVLKAASDINAHVSIQIEVETLKQLEEALTAGAKLILLDNFSTNQMQEAVAYTQGRAILEASGGITLENVRDIALTGVDRISIGTLTKHIHAIDLSMRFLTNT